MTNSSDDTARLIKDIGEIVDSKWPGRVKVAPMVNLLAECRPVIEQLQRERDEAIARCPSLEFLQNQNEVVIAGLRKAIEDAPHYLTCTISEQPYEGQTNYVCDCWKSEALKGD